MRLPPALIAFTPGDIEESERSQQLVRLVRGCAGVGLRGLVLREPHLADSLVLDLALRLREILADGWLCIHDRVHLAQAARADAVHLGWRSLAPAVARGVLPSDIALGFSSHAGDDPRAFEACDYLVFGPVRDTATKRGLREPTGFDGLARATEATTRPVWALGGMRLDDVAGALDAGASGVAVLGGIMHASDPSAACAHYLEALRARERR
jgi:thiamine-phosphate pyrophosphorylase